MKKMMLVLSIFCMAQALYAVRGPNPQEISIDDVVSGINSVRGSNVVRAAWRSGLKNSGAVIYNAESRKAELRDAFHQGREAVKGLLMRWGWTDKAFEHLFPANQSGDFCWYIFMERIENVVIAYDEMEPARKAAYCRLRNVDPKRGWATFMDYAPRQFR